MQSFTLQKFLFRLFYIVAFLMFIGIFVYAFNTEMALEEVGEEAPFTEETLRADNDTLPESRSLTPDEPHRTPRELARWVSQNVSEVMTMDAQNYDVRLDAAKVYFSQAGYEEFRTYLTQASLKSTLQQSDLKVGVIVEQTPLLLNSGVVSGVYRWLYEVPVTVSYTKRGITELTPDSRPAMSRKLTIRLQLGRHDDAVDQDGIRIESWKVSARR